MKYFRLASDCFLVEGEKEGAIYDVHGCKVFLLDKQTHKILRRCEDNEPLGDWLGESGMHFLNVLQDVDLGVFESSPTYVDKLLLHQPIEWKGMCMLPPKFFRADWAITNRCALNCDFCGRMDETTAWQSCQTCLRRNKDTETEWVPDNPEEFVDQIADLGARVLHIRGGNPLLAWDYLLKVVRAVCRTSLSLIITTPATSRPIEELLHLCSGDQVRLNIVMFGIDDEITSAVCGQKHVLTHQVALMDALAERQLSFFVTFFLTHTTRGQRRKMQEFVRNHWGGETSFAEVCFRKSMSDGFRLSHVEEHSKALTPWRSVEEFFFSIRYNKCTFGNFDVSFDGKLRSCAGIHRVHGDVAAAGLHEALSGNTLYETWELGKGSLQPCSACALRYACTDCSTFELEGQNDWTMKEAYCPHGPGCIAPGVNRRNWLPSGFVFPLSLNPNDLRPLPRRSQTSDKPE